MANEAISLLHGSERHLGSEVSLFFDLCQNTGMIYLQIVNDRRASGPRFFAGLPTYAVLSRNGAPSFA